MQPNTTPGKPIPFNPEGANGVSPPSDTVDFALSIERQPTGQYDVIATPQVKGLRTRNLARCRSERIAQVLVDALAERGVLP